VIPLLLAASLLQSVPAAVDATLAKHQAEDEARIAQLEARVLRDEQIAVATWQCFNRALIGAGADLMSTAVALKDNPQAQEANPLGFNTEARVALKLGQLGVTGATCYIANKSGHPTTAKIVSWTSFAVQMAATINNIIRAAKK
jgi:hypothetical protein